MDVFRMVEGGILLAMLLMEHGVGIYNSFCAIHL